MFKESNAKILTKQMDKRFYNSAQYFPKSIANGIVNRECISNLFAVEIFLFYRADAIFLARRVSKVSPEVPAVAKQRCKGGGGGWSTKANLACFPGNSALSVLDPSRRRLSRLSEIVGWVLSWLFRASLSKKVRVTLEQRRGGGSLGCVAWRL